jgi:hypothetical protein
VLPKSQNWFYLIPYLIKVADEIIYDIGNERKQSEISNPYT